MDTGVVIDNKTKQSQIIAKKEEKKKIKLSLKYRKWLRLYINTGNATKSALLSYDCNENSARSIGSENLAKLNYPEFLEQIGVSDHLLGTTLLEGLKAKSYDLTGKSYPNFSIRHKYLETGLKLKKRLTDNVQQQSSMIGLSINIVPSK